MTLSLNEVEATAKKATRGAGYPWGLAEEAGKATRWLCARGLDGCGALATLLVQTDGVDLGTWTPRCDASPWRSSGGNLCPLVAGAALSDRATAIRAMQLEGPVVPLLLVPFVGMVARHHEITLRIELTKAMAVTDGRSVALTGRFPDQASVAFIDSGGSLDAVLPDRHRAAPDEMVLNMLERFAHRTYAPATDASRLSGAGAGLADND